MIFDYIVFSSPLTVVLGITKDILLLSQSVFYHFNCNVETLPPYKFIHVTVVAYITSKHIENLRGNNIRFQPSEKVKELKGKEQVYRMY